MILLPISKKNSTNTKKKKRKTPRSKDVEDNRGDLKGKLKMMDVDLVEINDRIIRRYDISYDWCPRFFSVCAGIILFSKMIRKELIKKGIKRLLHEAEVKRSSKNSVSRC